MDEKVRNTISTCREILELINSGLISLNNETSDDVKLKLKETIELLIGFEKRAWLKTRSGREKIQLIEETSQKLEKMLRNDHLDELLFLNALSDFKESVKKVDEEIKRKMWFVT